MKWGEVEQAGMFPTKEVMGGSGTSPYEFYLAKERPVDVPYE